MAGEETEGKEWRKEEEERGGKRRRGWGGAFSEGERQKRRASIKLKAECAAGRERKTDWLTGREREGGEEREREGGGVERLEGESES